MSRGSLLRHPLLVVVGSGGVGKTTLAAALGVAAARSGAETLVMTFDPSRRLKDTLGVGVAASDREVPVRLRARGALYASLLDAGATFDRLIARYAPDEASAERIFRNRFYRHLAGSLAGILEYMAVERLFEVAEADRYDRIVLDTPPTRQALDFLQAPDRIVGFLDSGALRIALRPWFDAGGRVRGGVLGRGIEALLDRLVGMGLLRDMAEFFQAFAPLYQGFRERAESVRAQLRDRSTAFVLVAGPGEERNADTMFFARRLVEDGYHLRAVVANQLHPPLARAALPDPPPDGLRLLAWQGDRDQRGLAALRELLPDLPVAGLPLLPVPPTGVSELGTLGRDALRRLAAPRDPPARAKR